MSEGYIRTGAEVAAAERETRRQVERAIQSMSLRRWAMQAALDYAGKLQTQSIDPVKLAAEIISFIEGEPKYE